MTPENNDTLITGIGGLTAVLISAAFWLRKLKPTFAKDDLAAKAAEADMGVIERMSREADRMAKQNDLLAQNLNQFQLQLLTLQTENNKLSLENNSLREENMSLREEIMELRNEIATLTRTVMNLQANNCNGCQYAPHNALPHD